MASVAQQIPTSVKSMDVQAILKRGIGINVAMKSAAQMLCDREGKSFESIKALEPDYRNFIRQLVEEVIAKFQEATVGKPEADPKEVQRIELDAYLQIARQTAAVCAAARGHVMGPWATVPNRHDESSACVRCSRVATLVVSYGPELEIIRHGTALTEGCLTAAPEVA